VFATNGIALYEFATVEGVRTRVLIDKSVSVGKVYTVVIDANPALDRSILNRTPAFLVYGVKIES
jgi:hypothetical protein